MDATLMRYMMESGKGSTGSFLTSKAVVSGEFPQINPKFNTQDYKYFYLLENPNFDNSFIRKVSKRAAEVENMHIFVEFTVVQCQKHD